MRDALRRLVGYTLKQQQQVQKPKDRTCVGSGSRSGEVHRAALSHTWYRISARVCVQDVNVSDSIVVEVKGTRVKEDLS